jgi:hypothetical protein
MSRIGWSSLASMVVGLIVFLAISGLAGAVVFPALILGARSDRYAWASSSLSPEQPSDDGA